MSPATLFIHLSTFYFLYLYFKVTITLTPYRQILALVCIRFHHHDLRNLFFIFHHSNGTCVCFLSTINVAVKSLHKAHFLILNFSKCTMNINFFMAATRFMN